MKTVRIGAGAGYAGDRIEPAIKLLEEGDLDYMIFECLAERTISLAQQHKLNNPTLGYDPLLVERMQRILPALKSSRVRIISNMGAANPLAAAEKIRDLAAEAGMSGVRIAAISGDELSDRLDAYLDLEVLETGKPLREFEGRIISANAYTGGHKITEALEHGARIVITGRTADPALVTAPLMHEFRKPYDDYEFLGKATLAGHLLECAGQVTGGYFADPGFKEVPDLWNIGFPIACIDESGSTTIKKLPDTGGAVSAATVKEQLLYEIEDPANYLTPDVIADFSRATVNDMGDEGVVVDGATGKEKSGLLKVSVAYLDGYIGEGEISYGGPGALPRAKLAAQIISKRFEMLDFKPRELRVDFIGVNSLYGSAGGDPMVRADGTNAMADTCRDVRLRVAGRAETENEAKTIGREVEALYTNGPAGGGGARAYSRKVLSLGSIFVPESDVVSDVMYFDL